MGIYAEVLLQFLSVKIQMAFLNTFSVVKGIRRPDIQFIPAKSAKEIDQILLLLFRSIKFMLSTKTKEITLSVRGEQYNSFAFPRGLEATMNFHTSAILTGFSVEVDLSKSNNLMYAP